MRYFILFLAALAFGGENAVPLPPEAVQAISAYDKACAEAQAKADAAKADAAKRLVPLLEASLKKATQAGNLDAAMALKAKKEEIVDAVWANAIPAAGGLAPEKIIGSWVIESGSGVGSNFIFLKNGTWSSPWPSFTGKWQIDNGAVIMTPADGRACAATMTGERNMLIKTNVTCVLKKQGR